MGSMTPPSPGMPRIAVTLAQLPLFSDMHRDELERLAQGCSESHYIRSQDVFRIGDPCSAFHVVLSGLIKLYAISPSGQEKVIELVGPGQSFGEALMFTDQPYIINAQSLIDTRVLAVRKPAVMAEIERDPRFALRMLAGISRQLHGLVHDVESYALHSGVQRVVAYLLRDEVSAHCEDCQVRTITLPVSKATIASRLSLTPEYFSRVLHELAEQHLIEIDKRDIRLLDVVRLARFRFQ